MVMTRADIRNRIPRQTGKIWTFNPGDDAIDGYVLDSSQYGFMFKPGDVLVFNGGDYDTFDIRNIHGTPDNPITIINANGQVHTTGTGNQFRARNLRHIHFSGAGDPNFFYGWLLDGGGTAYNGRGMYWSWRSVGIECHHVEIANAGVAGIMVHTVDDTNADYLQGEIGQPSSWLTGANPWIDSGYRLHHLYWHDTEQFGGFGEGCYIGNNNADTKDSPDMQNMWMWSCVGSTTSAEAFDFKYMTGARIWDIWSYDSAYNNISSGQVGGIRLSQGFGGTLSDSYVFDNVGHGLNTNSQFRPIKLDGLHIDGSARAGFSYQPAAGVTSDAVLTMLNCTSINPPNNSDGDGLIFDHGNAAGAAASSVTNNRFEYDALAICIDEQDFAIGTEEDNICTEV